MMIYIGGIQPFMNLQGLELVTNARRKRIQAYIKPEDKARCLVAGLLLRKVCDVAGDEQLTASKNGKPYLRNSGMYFNISHSGEYVVLAVADNEIGVDIEKIAPYDQAIAVRCFTERELEWLQSQGADEAFYRLWTAKESVMKASGLGFSLPPETFSVLPMDASAHTIAGNAWFLHWLLYEGHMICCAIGDRTEKMEVYDHETLIR